MKEKKTLRCICCGKTTIHREMGWWVHKKCLEEIKYYIMLAQHELPTIQMRLLFGNKRLLEAAIMAVINGQTKKIKRIRKDIKKKAWKILQQNYGKPHWIK